MLQEKTCGGQDLAKGLAAGFVGGLVAAWVMNNFQTFWSDASSAIQHAKEQKKKAQQEKEQEPQTPPPGNALARQRHESGQQGGPSSGQEQEPATVRAAEVLSQNVLHHKLTPPEKKVAGPVMHYAMGVGTGTLYGALSELTPDVTAGGGLLWGGAVWLLADEATVPVLGLSKSPMEYPASSHIYALASHLVYGMTTELVRRIVRRVL